MLNKIKAYASVVALLMSILIALPTSQGVANASTVEAAVPVQVIALETANQYIGTRYCRGGETPKCFDCSGFVSYVYSLQGIDLPRTAHGQYRVATKIPAAEAQPGDLVFFYYRSGWVHHVGIYLGDGKVLHSPRHGGRVRIESIWTSRVKYGRI